jgi:competence protein ComEC
MLEKPKLFLNLKEFSLTIVFLLFFILIRLFFLYQEYDDFKNKPFYYTDVDVVQAYEKIGDKGTYTVLKVYSPTLNIRFFTSSSISLEMIYSRLRLKLFPSRNHSFIDYLGTSYISSQINQIYQEEIGTKNELLVFIEEQHEHAMLSSFYKAIYFATPLDKKLREQVSVLGVSHLIALSGFHLAILSGILFFILRPLYQTFQVRYFPYRYALHDVGLIILILLAIYVWFVGMPPSLIRSYSMMVVGWVLLVLGMELLSFGFLFIITIILIMIFPHLLVSIAFWFSVSGVFYIFLFIKYFAQINKYLLTLLINFIIFLLMLPLIHMVFPMVSLLQLLSPLLSLLFIVFYPLSILLHLFGIGEVLDEFLLYLLSLEHEKSIYLLPPLYGIGYIVLSLIAVYHKKWFYLLLLVSIIFSLTLFTGF